MFLIKFPKDFDYSFIDLICPFYVVASTLSLPHCRTRTEEQIAKYCPTGKRTYRQVT